MSELASGGFGSLYVARQRGFEREVAVKFLTPSLWQDADALARFEREAKIIAGLSHKNIAPCYAYGIWGGKVPYLVLELLHGTTLRQTLRAAGKLPWERSFSLGVDLCSALAQAHAAGVVHRDIKPENIFITDDGTVKLLDFGLSRVGDQQLTEAGTLLGTVLYMSPEQAAGKTATTSSDIYSLGCVLYESIAGHPPHVANDPMAVLHLQLKEYPQLLATANDTIPAKVDNVLFKAMSKEPEGRYADALSFGTDLRNALTQKDFIGVTPCEISSMSAFDKPNEKHSKGHQLFAMIAVVALIVLPFALIFSSSTLSQALLVCANAIPAKQRTATIESWADSLESMHLSEAAAILYKATTQLPAIDPVQRIRQLDKLTRTLLQQNDQAAAAKVVSQSKDYLSALEMETPLSTRDAQTILSALTLDLHVVDPSQLGRIHNELFNAGTHVENVLWNNRMFDQWECSRELNFREFESAPIDRFCQVLLGVMKLEQEQQYGLIGKLVKHKMTALEGNQRLDPDLRKLYESLIAEANKRHSAKKQNYSEPLASVTYPWLVGPALTSHEKKLVLEALCNSMGDYTQEWQVAPLYTFLVKSRPSEDDYSDNGYQCLVQFVHGAALMQSGKSAEAAEEFIAVTKKSDEIYLLLSASKTATALLSSKTHTNIKSAGQLEKLAKILQLRENENRTEDSSLTNSIGNYGLLQGKLLAAEKERVLRIRDLAR